MLYFKSAQPVPGKGQAWTFYECDDSRTVLRTLTFIPGTGEVSRVPDPIVKFLYRPELLHDAEAEEFLELWGDA
jgi:hypothetical protein